MSSYNMLMELLNQLTIDKMTLVSIRAGFEKYQGITIFEDGNLRFRYKLNVPEMTYEGLIIDKIDIVYDQEQIDLLKEQSTQLQNTRVLDDDPLISSSAIKRVKALEQQIQILEKGEGRKIPFGKSIQQFNTIEDLLVEIIKYLDVKLVGKVDELGLRVFRANFNVKIPQA